MAKPPPPPAKTVSTANGKGDAPPLSNHTQTHTTLGLPASAQNKKQLAVCQAQWRRNQRRD